MDIDLILLGIRNELALAMLTIASPEDPMFIVILEFSDNKSKAGQFMTGHNEWIKRGLDEGIFLLVGSLQPNRGGAILAHDISRSALEGRVNDDPFVVEKVVSAEILEVTPSKADERLSFLLG